MDTCFPTLRPLGVIEEYFWLFDHSSPMHFCIAAEVKGRTRVSDWRAAVDALQARHPMLSVSIDSSQQRVPHFYRTSGGRVPLRVAPLGTTWEREVEREIATLFDPTEGPLARVVLIHESEKVFVLLVTHHAISDGLSSIYMLRDLLEALSGQQLAPYDFPPSIDQILGAPTRPTSAPGKRLSHALAVERLKKPVHVKGLAVASETTTLLRERARREGTTMHGIICAAATLAGRAIDAAWRDQAVSIFSPVNLRKLLQLNDECVVAVSKTSTVIDPKAPSDIWEMARSVAASLLSVKTLEGGAPVFSAVYEAMSTDMDETDGARFNADAFSDTMLVSNLGQVPFSSSIGELTIEALWAPVVLRGHDTEQTIGVSTINGSLHLVHSSWYPLPGFLEEIQARLQNASR
ncbi:condensation domain-containing protein [Rhizobium sp. BK376]|uniref:phthiocerol/phthiodiolone dimycocerosyl transferase family protein n=1 Tax=Rhizobium sp. BK376 TaxID=2512149 RepID=UPI00104E2309|nr:condensation domain-containing protein [Rhizobium sp. BK376]TCR73371.1 condensation domain-containing protein [Rhizobium sp. BK376]